jgi:uncharacterized protein
MQLHRFDNIQKFWQTAQAYLLQHEAENNVLLGVLHTLLHNPDRYLDPPYLAIAKTNDDILAVAIRTPPHKLLLSKATAPTAWQLIAQDLSKSQEQLPGFMGLVADAEIFLQTWQMFTGKQYQVTVAMRIHQLTAVRLTSTVNGYLRLATADDRSLLRQWIPAFSTEVGLLVQDDTERVIDQGLKFQNIYIWENADGLPVSLASGRAAGSVARIGLVYTPPENRNQGYASACVSAVSQRLLAQGYHRCFLLTDLANSTSNHIYAEIGYRGVCDWHEYSLISLK